MVGERNLRRIFCERRILERDGWTTMVVMFSAMAFIAAAANGRARVFLGLPWRQGRVRRQSGVH